MTNRFAGLGQVAVATQTPIAPAIPGVTVHEHGKRLSEEEEALVKHLFKLDLGTTWYAPGTEMLAGGKKVAMQLYQQWEKQKLAGDTVAELKAIIEKEGRVDYTLPLNRLYLDNVGLLAGVNGRVLLDDHAFNQLSNRYPTSLGLPRNLRRNVNFWISQVKDELTAFVRTRKKDPVSGVAMGYAVLSDRYEVCDFTEVAEIILQTMPHDARATFMYDGRCWRITVTLAQPFDVGTNEAQVGRLHQIAAIFESADDGSLALTGRVQAIRIRCINCTLVETGRLVFKYRHTKQKAEDKEGLTLREVVEQTFASLGEAMEVFASRWRKAYQTSMVDSITGKDVLPEDVFRRLVVAGYVSVPWKDPQETVELLMAAFDREPGRTAAHINMAITRMARESYQEFSNPWVADDLSLAAGRLLEQEVFDLPPLSKRQQELFLAA